MAPRADPSDEVAHQARVLVCPNEVGDRALDRGDGQPPNDDDVALFHTPCVQHHVAARRALAIRDHERIRSLVLLGVTVHVLHVRTSRCPLAPMILHAAARRTPHHVTRVLRKQDVLVQICEARDKAVHCKSATEEAWGNANGAASLLSAQAPCAENRMRRSRLTPNS